MVQAQCTLILLLKEGGDFGDIFSPFFTATAEPWESTVLALFLSPAPRLNFLAAGRRSGVAVLPFLHLTLFFTLRQI